MDLYEMISRNEGGNRLRVYLDCCGESWRDCVCDPDKRGRLTVGVGRNLDDRGISGAEGFAMFQNDVALAKAELSTRLAWTDTLDEPRYAVFVDMCFNMGIGRLLGFKNMLAAAHVGNWGEAATELLDSAYAQQVGIRATRNAKQLLTGEWQK